MCEPFELLNSSIDLFEKSCDDFSRVLLSVARKGLIDLPFDDGLGGNRPQAGYRRCSAARIVDQSFPSEGSSRLAWALRRISWTNSACDNPIAKSGPCRLSNGAMAISARSSSGSSRTRASRSLADVMTLPYGPGSGRGNQGRVPVKDIDSAAIGDRSIQRVVVQRAGLADAGRG